MCGSCAGLPAVRRDVPERLARGVPSALHLVADEPARLRLRQPVPPDLSLEPAQAEHELSGQLLALRRGRHVLPPVVTRRTGPLGLAAWTHSVGEKAEVLVYPDLPAARRLAASVRAGKFRDEGLRRRGPSVSERSSTPSATTRRTTTSARSTGARPRGSAGR